MVDFYLITNELVPEKVYAPRACHILRWLHNAVRDDLALVSVHPPIPKEVYHTDRDLAELMLGPHLHGESLRTMNSDPVYVYICRLNYQDEPIPDNVHDNFVILDWGAVYKTEGAALEGLRREGMCPRI